MPILSIAHRDPDPRSWRPSGVLFLSGLALILTACGDAPVGRSGVDGAATSAPAVDVTQIDFSPDLGIDLSHMERTESGLYFRDEVVGDGTELQQGQDAVLHYTGFHPDGRSFDSSQGGSPFRVRIGVGRVIQGWDEGVPGMREGGRRILVIPPELAYGREGAGGGVIPPNAVLVFQVDLVEVP